jgi:hypothetical protein
MREPHASVPDFTALAAQAWAPWLQAMNLWRDTAAAMLEAQARAFDGALRSVPADTLLQATAAADAADDAMAWPFTSGTRRSPAPAPAARPRRAR